MRTFLTAVAGVLAGCLAFLAMSISLAWWTAGTAENLSATVVSVLDSPAGAQALGTALVDRAVDAAPDRDRRALQARAPELSAAAAAALSKAREPVAEVVRAAFSAVAGGVRVAIDLRPVLQPVLSALHLVEPSIPALADGSSSTIDLDGSALGAVATAVAILGLWWVAVLLALVLLVATAFASRAAGWRRLRPAGIALAVPAVIVLLLSLAPSIVTASQATGLAAGLIASTIDVVRTRGLLISLIAGLLAAGLIGLSFIRPGRPVVPAAEHPAPPASA